MQLTLYSLNQNIACTIKYKLHKLVHQFADQKKPEPEVLQPDAFCEPTMRQNETAAGVLPQTPLELLLKRSSKVMPPGVDGGGEEEGKGQRWRRKRVREKERSKEGGEKEGTDFYFNRAQLEPGRRLVKAGPGGRPI